MPSPNETKTEAALDAVTLPFKPTRPTEDPDSHVALAKTLVKGGEAATDSASTPQVNAEPAPIVDEGFEARYRARSILGEGGMGEVRLVRDVRVGRDVAMKVIRAGVGSRSDLRLRFEREARVQGQLEHPAIVPVYDLGVGPDGAAFFTMKRIRGHTFEEIIEALRDGDPVLSAQYTTRKLLAAFDNVALAIAFAHARGVLHRDLKPANVMLGDFGEVYVLDWGLAKLLAQPGQDGGDEPVSRRAFEADATLEAHAIAVSPAATAMGAIMGTPGYMAPEQVRGEGDALDARADLYALGAILFELLALEPLHPRASTQEAILLSTLTGADARFSSRVPDRGLPPELEAIVVRATALDPDDRYPTARAMVDDLERFLDGDRDLQRRRELAALHAEKAASAPEGARGEAIREVNRALALDPTHAGALSTMLRLLVEVPAEVPKEAEEELEAMARRTRLSSERISAWGYLVWLLFTPFVFWMGIRDLPAMIVLGVSVLASFVLARLIGSGKVDEMPTGYFLFAASLVAVGLSALFFGPFVVVPGVASANTLLLAMNLKRGVARKLAIGASALPILVPLLLEWAGVLAPSYAFRDHALVLLPRMVSFPPAATFGFLLVANVGLVIVPALLVARSRDEAHRAERRVFLHLWHLRQFIPDEARSAAVMQTPATETWEACIDDAFHRHLRAKRPRP